MLSFLFRKVYTINNNDNKTAKKLNEDRENIVYLNMDLYSNLSHLVIKDIPKEVSMFLIDAGHDYMHVIKDINLAFSLYTAPECYLVFDDYGLEKYKWDVRKAIDEAMSKEVLTLVKKIGHKPGFNFGGKPARILDEYEGVITKIKY